SVSQPSRRPVEAVHPLSCPGSAWNPCVPRARTATTSWGFDGGPWHDGPMGTRISDRIAAIAPSATLAVDAKAKALKAAGENVIGFGAGEPDFPTPDHIVEAAVAACRDPRYHHYSPTAGLPE